MLFVELVGAAGRLGSGCLGSASDIMLLVELVCRLADNRGTGSNRSGGLTELVLACRRIYTSSAKSDSTCGASTNEGDKA